MPFAGYDNFDACTRDNSDKDDPEAYCAAIKRQIEGADALSDGEKQALARKKAELQDEDPCQEGWVMVGTKVKDGQTVPNCVPEEDADPANLMADCPEGQVEINGECVEVEDVDAPPSVLSEPRVLAARNLAGPIEREELSNGSVLYSNIKILSEGAWVDSESREEIYYDPRNLEVVDGATVNVMHDDENDVSAVGAIKADSAYVEDGDLYADVQLHRDNAASEYADENLQKTLESEGEVGFGGPSVEIPADGQEIDMTANPPELEDGKIDGLAFVSQPAARTTAFAQQARERAVALSDGEDNKGVYVKEDSMSDLELQDPGEVREILSMFGFDADDLDDEEVMDMAEDLHEDLMDELGGEDRENAEHDDDDDEEDEEQEMGSYEDDEDTDMADDGAVDVLEEQIDDLWGEIEDLKEGMDMEAEVAELSEAVEALEADVEAKEKELSEAKERIEELESEPEDPKSLADAGVERDETDTAPVSPSQSRGY